jgi:hypothetical protein
MLFFAKKLLKNVGRISLLYALFMITFKIIMSSSYSGCHSLLYIKIFTGDRIPVLIINQN